MKTRDVKSIEDLRFNVTEEMNNTFIEILLTQQMLQNKNLKKKERKLLEEHLEIIRKQFILDFRKNNVEERKLYNDFMNK